MAVAIETSFGQQLDNSGAVLNGGTVTVYDAGTTTIRNIYSDTGLSSAASNPITLDSAGRHDMRYTAATAYKIVVKNSGGTTLYTRDNIDPGVPIGSGYLAIANGGTGATNATTALSNLGGATAAELADLATDVAELAGAAASSEKTQIATGTTAQRPSSPANGQIRRNTTIPQWEGYDGTDWDAFITDDNSASTANTAAESSSELYVKPSVMKYHPGIAKAWARVTITAGTPSYTDSWGFATGTAITDTAAGDWTFTLSTAMANANYACIATAHDTTGVRVCHVHTLTTTTIRIQVVNASGTTTDPVSVSIIVFGDL